VQKRPPRRFLAAAEAEICRYDATMKLLPFLILFAFLAGCGGSRSEPAVKQKTADNPITSSAKEMAKDHEGPGKK
jgi:hypothetical protein